MLNMLSGTKEKTHCASLRIACFLNYPSMEKIVSRINSFKKSCNERETFDQVKIFIYHYLEALKFPVGDKEIELSFIY